MDSLLINMYNLEAAHEKNEYFHALNVISLMMRNHKNVRKIIEKGMEEDLINSNSQNEYRLTQKGIKKALSAMKGGSSI